MPRSNFHFVPLRNLWVSLLPREMLGPEGRFPGAQGTNPARLVKTHKFQYDFWPTLTKKQRGDLGSEQAWFGIRSLLKGGSHGLDIQEFTIDHFGQLSSDSSGENIHRIARGATKDFFQSHDLRTLIEIHSLYEKWKQREGLYDDLDLVRVAHKSFDASSSSNESKELRRLNPQQVERAIKGMSSKESRFKFKQPAIRSYMKESPNSTQRKSTQKWIEKWRRKWNSKIQTTYRGIFLGTSKGGVPVFKERLTKAARVIYSVVKEPDAPEYAIVYDLVWNHDAQNEAIARALGLDYGDLPELYSDDDAGWEQCADGFWTHRADEKHMQEIITAEIRSVDDLPGEGPSKPLPHAENISIEEAMDHLDDPGNISLTDEQKRSILQPEQPLLIDGLAGTGKTAVLAKRAAISAGFSEKPRTILVTCSNPEVVNRLYKDVNRTLTFENLSSLFSDHAKRADHYSVGFEESGVNKVWTHKFQDLIPKSGYDEIIIDECQDLTFLEFDLLRKLCDGHNPHRLTMGGDPLQTLNPTGFDWGRIRAMFMQYGVEKNATEPAIFHDNYRSVRDIVELANALQFHRAKATGESPVVMNPKRESFIQEQRQPILFSINNEHDRRAVSDALSIAGQSPVNWLCWAVDDQALVALLEGEDKDPMLSAAWGDIISKADEDDVDVQNFRLHLYVHSSTSVKGREFTSIALFRFASSNQFVKDLDSLQTDYRQLPRIQQDQLIRVKFAYSRLYVALTRAFEKVYLIEEPSGVNFWKSIQLNPRYYQSRGTPSFDEEAPPSDAKYINLDYRNDTAEWMNSLDFVENVEATEDRFEEHMKQWKKNQNIVDLHFAINLGRKLKDEHAWVAKKLSELEGEYCLYLASKVGTSHNDQQRLFDQALSHFETARLFERCAPIY